MTLKRIKAKGIEVVVYEPELKDTNFVNSRVETDLHLLKRVDGFKPSFSLNDGVLWTLTG